MYNDENNPYNYTYRKDGSELSHQRETVRSGGQSGPRGPELEMRPVKKNRIGLKIAALALSCALLGGAAGGEPSGPPDSMAGETRARLMSPAAPLPRWPCAPWTARRP